MLMGLTQDPAVVPVLVDAANDPMPRSDPLERAIVRIQIAEALLNLGREESLEAIRGAAYSKDDEVRVLAVLMIGRAGDRAMKGNLINFLSRNPVELRLAAADALARIGSDEGLSVMLECAEHPSATVRMQAAFALGQLPAQASGADKLSGLLEDAEPAVRLSAAASILDALAAP